MNFIKKIFFNDSRDKLLYGEWQAIYIESENLKMSFYPDGTLVYKIIYNDKTQIMNLTYYTRNGFIISNQPSKPKEETTKYYFENNYTVLCLEFEGELTKFYKT
ncbi:MAG TPA: hypothetical protein VK169_19270 [Saprospiraceae bacterium]|jgi:hypothetical protein|nr:hypothetical protein [Saprospiraceae bacterium]